MASLFRMAMELLKLARTPNGSLGEFGPINDPIGGIDRDQRTRARRACSRLLIPGVNNGWASRVWRS
jgi:hypothetical protein